jgi:hypothetical protein
MNEETTIPTTDSDQALDAIRLELRSIGIHHDLSPTMIVEAIKRLVAIARLAGGSSVTLIGVDLDQ